MVLHELATNAAKHGALSAPGGRVTVAWAEEGGPPVREPERRDFGSELIERELRHDLGGAIEMVYEPAGLRATLTLPAGVIGRYSSDSEKVSTTAKNSVESKWSSYEALLGAKVAQQSFVDAT